MKCKLCEKEIHGEPVVYPDEVDDGRGSLTICEACDNSEWVTYTDLIGDDEVEVTIPLYDLVEAGKNNIASMLDEFMLTLNNDGWCCGAIKIEAIPKEEEEEPEGENPNQLSLL